PNLLPQLLRPLLKVFHSLLNTRLQLSKNLQNKVFHIRGDTEPILENMYYDRIAYDFDSEWSPQLAVETAREFLRLLK
ncbi:MAG: hypothetical protein LM567_01825, partial [Desulfurococcaceae archaeon]|nr:hypothetical protein [Desulfurococcaceae archaeon]